MNTEQTDSSEIVFTFSIDMEQELSEIYDEWMLVPGNELDFDSKPESRKIFLAVWELWFNVLWDGFTVCFCNTKESLKFVHVALAAIGATTSLTLFREAFSTTFPAGLPPTLEETSRQSWSIYTGNDVVCWNIKEKCHELDSQFYEYRDDLPALLYAFVLKHPEEFGEHPKLTNKQGHW